MPFNGVGMFVRLRNWVADAAAGVKIRADYHDLEDDGFADGLSHCVTKDGQTTITQNIPMNSKRIVALADPIDPQDASTKAYADTKLPLAGGTITGTLNVNGNLNVGGVVAAVGYRTRPGLPGPYGVNYFNFNWTGAAVEAWVDNSNIGALATQTYAEQQSQGWAAYYAAPKVNRAGDTMTGLLNTAPSGPLWSGGGLNSIMVYGNQGDYAGMTFHSPGTFACNFGMHPNGDFYQGGWSLGAGNVYKFWTERNLIPILSGRLSDAGSPGLGSGASNYEPYSGAVVTGLSTVASGQTTSGCVNGAKWRYMQLLTPGGWFTVGYSG